MRHTCVAACKVGGERFCHRCHHEHAHVCHAFHLFVGHYSPESRQKAIFRQERRIRVWSVCFCV